jgi:hypothetical protein
VSDPDKLLNQICQFREQCAELDCLGRPYTFASDHARSSISRDVGRQPDSPAHEEFACDVVLMSGLPGRQRLLDPQERDR